MESELTRKSDAKTLIKLLIGAPVAAFAVIFFFLVVVEILKQAPTPIAETIHKNCLAQFGSYDSSAVSRCEIDVMTAYLAGRERDRIGSVLKSVR